MGCGAILVGPARTCLTWGSDCILIIAQLVGYKTVIDQPFQGHYLNPGWFFLGVSNNSLLFVSLFCAYKTSANSSFTLDHPPLLLPVLL